MADEWDAWASFQTALRHAHRIAHGERMNELIGKRVRTFDERGLHPYSEIWGQINMLAAHPEVHARLAELDSEEVPTPAHMRRLAHEEADADFIRAIREGGEAVPAVQEWMRDHEPGGL